VNKILPFKIDSEFYFDLSEQSYNEGNLFKALMHLSKITKPTKADLNRLYFWYAKILSDMHCIQQSNNYYYKLLSNKELESIATFEIGRNFLSGGFLEKAKYYFKHCILVDKYLFFSEAAKKYLEIINHEQAVSKFKIIEANTITLISNLKTQSAEENIRINYSNIYKGAVKSMLKSLKRKNYTEAILLGKEILKNSSAQDFEHIFALCALITANFEIGDFNLLENYLQSALQLINCKDLKTLELIATTLSGISKHSLAKLFFDKIEELAPYDYNIIFLNAICSFNIKDRKSAVEKISKVILMVNKDRVLDYYLNEFNSAPFTELEYLYALPEKESQKIIHSLLLGLNDNLIEINANFLLDLEWLLLSQNTKLAFKIFDFLIKNKSTFKSIKNFITNMLTNVFINNQVKRQLVVYAIKSGNFNNFNVVINDYYFNVKSIKYSALLVESEALANAYIYALANLIQTGNSSQINLLNDIVKTALKSIKEQIDTKKLVVDEDNLFKVMHYLSVLPISQNTKAKYKLKTVLKNLKECINTFGLNQFYDI
jgi:hypothetical protein